MAVAQGRETLFTTMSGEEINDSDHPRSLGEVGREGVVVDTLDDMDTLFRGIPMADVSTSMTINAPAALMLAFYVAPELERKQIGRVQAVRAGRDQNLMEPLLDCARAHCTEGEIVESLQRVFGTYTETPVF